MKMGGNLKLIVLLSIIWLKGFQLFGQTDPLKQHKIRFDWELGPPGAGVNFSIQKNDKNSFGLGLNVLYYDLVILPHSVYEESEPYNWDFLNGKIFYRNFINKRIILEYALKYSYSHFDCFYCEHKNNQLYGLQFAFIFGNRHFRYRPTLAVNRSIEDLTYFIYIVPLVFIFNLK